MASSCWFHIPPDMHSISGIAYHERILILPSKPTISYQVRNTHRPSVGAHFESNLPSQFQKRVCNQPFHSSDVGSGAGIFRLVVGTESSSAWQGQWFVVTMSGVSVTRMFKVWPPKHWETATILFQCQDDRKGRFIKCFGGGRKARFYFMRERHLKTHREVVNSDVHDTCTFVQSLWIVTLPVSTQDLCPELYYCTVTSDQGFF